MPQLTSKPILANKATPDADRRLRQADRLARVLRVLQLIQSRGRWDTKSIAKELECSERTVYRDLTVLELAGVPWIYNKSRRGYEVRPDYQFPTINLSEDELIGQATATAALQADGLNVTVGPKPTTQKIAATNEKAEELLAEAQRFTQVLDLKIADHSRHKDTIKTIQWALLGRKQLTGQYKSPFEQAVRKMTLHPYRLCLVKSAWYLIAAETGGKPKTYRITRFKTLRMLDQTADIPEEFDLRSYFGNAWSVYRGAKTFEVQLEFSATVADIVAETVWHPTQEIKKLPNGQLKLTFKIDGLEEIVRWIMGWAGNVRVVTPPELRELVVQKHQSAIDANRK